MYSAELIQKVVQAILRALMPEEGGETRADGSKINFSPPVEKFDVNTGHKSHVPDSMGPYVTNISTPGGKIAAQYAKRYGSHLTPEQLAHARARDVCMGAGARGEGHKTDYDAEYLKAFKAIGGNAMVQRYARTRTEVQDKAKLASDCAKQACLQAAAAGSEIPYESALAKSRSLLSLS